VHVLAAALALLLAGCTTSEGGSSASTAAPAATKKHGKPTYAITLADTAGLSRAIFAGGCFWCVETAFEGLPGVKAVISGFVGGSAPEPTYDQVSSGATDYTEAVLVTFDPAKTSYAKLLEVFWVNHDPTTKDRQFCDWGHQYRPGIFYVDGTQKQAAHASVAWAEAHRKFQQPIVTEITKAGTFWPAEEYHQDFWKKDPVRYTTYRAGCGRDARLAQLWGKDAAKAMKH
jgi:peptide-methionine (S)-S-oxide reductase